jgi:dUTP pyrophosphatase
MKIKLLDPKLKPERGSGGAAGLDLKCDGDYTIRHNQVTKFGTGVKVAVPEGYVLLIVPRSSTKLKLVNTVGVIDSDYRGEVFVKCRAEGETFRIKKGERVVQAILVPCLTPELDFVDDLDTTDRGENGFGSTGK